MDKQKFIEAYNESRNGTDGFVRHPLVRKFAYSLGVQECAEAGCYWLLDVLATELPAEMRKHKDESNRAIVKVHVSDSQGRIVAEIEDDWVIWSKDIEWTDLPDGEWNFMVSDEGYTESPYRMILLSEY